MKTLISLFAAVLLISGMAMATPSFFGTSGAILTPDDTILDPGGFSANYDGLSLDDQNPNVIGASVGMTGGFELGLSRFDPDIDSGASETIINIKYLILPETVRRPSLIIGAVDLTGTIDPDGDAGFYAVVGKNLTSLATGVTGRPSLPLHGYLGYGGGIYDGFFAGLTWSVSDNLRLKAEFISQIDIKDTLSKKSMFNAGASFAFNERLSGNLALLDGEDLGFGLSYVRAIE